MLTLEMVRRSRLWRLGPGLLRRGRALRENARVTLRRAMIRHVNPERPEPMPSALQIEPTSMCNLRCVSCSHSRDSAAGRHLDLPGLRAILDRLPRRPRSVILSGIGEPLVHPGYFELVDVLGSAGIGCSFYTNGTLLSEKNRQAILSRPGISSVAISCDSAKKEVFEALRVGACYDRWVEEVGRFAADARRLRTGTLGVAMYTVLSKHNLPELDELVRFAGALRFKAIVLFDAIPLDEQAAALCLPEDELNGIDRRRLRRLGQRCGVRVDMCFRRPAKPPQAAVRCLQPWDYAFVRVGGDVAPCRTLLASDKAPVMGNLFHQNFAEIWHGDRFREFRRASATGTNPICSRCPYY